MRNNFADHERKGAIHLKDWFTGKSTEWEKQAERETRNCNRVGVLYPALEENQMSLRVAFVYLLLAVATMGSITPPAVAGESQWLEVRSPHFSVITDAGEKRGREAAMRFEQMRTVFGELMTQAKITLPVPLQIVAFRNSKELRQVAPLWHGKPTEVAGLFQAGQDRSYIMLDMSVPNPWSVVFHEYGHQLMNGNLSAAIDPWFEEGFAEFFSSIEVDSKQARVGKIPEIDYRILQQDGFMRVADLFRVQHNSKAYNESGDHRTVFYAESAMVVHYLYDKQLVAKTGVYFADAIDKKMPVEDAIQHAFGVSATQFDKDLRQYASSGRYQYYALPTPPGIDSKNYEVTEMNSVDGNAIVAEIHLHSPDYLDRAMAEFQEILKSNPDHPGALRGLGYAYLEKKDYEQAAGYFRRAAQRDSKDPRVHYYSAMLMTRENGFNDQADLPAIMKELEMAVSLDPSFADAYSLLAFAQTFAGEPEKGLQTIQKAVALSPRDPKYRFDLAEMYLNNKKPDDAIALLRSLERSDNQQHAMQIAQALQQAESMKQKLATGVRIIMPNEKDVQRVTTEQPIIPAGQGEIAAKAEVVPVAANQRAPKFLKGELVSVDCSAPPTAVMIVRSGSKTWKMKVADSMHVIVIGAENFSCGWTDQKVALNYHETGEGEGSVMTVEIQ